MGIKGLLGLLRDVAPQIFIKTHISKYEWRKIGVDISLFLYKYKAKSGNDYMNSVAALLLSIKQARVHPIIVFDGKAPKEKDDERKKRKNAKVRLEERSVALISAIKTFKDNGEECEVIKDAMERIKKRDKIDDVTIDMIEELQKRIESQIIEITYEDIINIKDICDRMGIQWIQAPGEAEACCVRLCKLGKISGVLSEDSDIITYGSPVFLSKYNIGSGTCVEVRYEDVLKGLGLLEKEFLDLCIMCGTDYNSNIPRIGPKTAYKLILAKRNIDNIEHDEVSILNHKRVREIFTTFDGRCNEIDCVPLEWNLGCHEVDMSSLQEFLIYHNCKDILYNINPAYKSVEVEVV